MNERGKSIDNTYLSIDTAERRGFIHRDYVAHCLRWSHVIKRITERKGYASASLLDVGCGRELPLAKTLYSSRLIVKNYFGVDAGPINDEAIGAFASGKFPLECWDDTDICGLTLGDLGDVRPNWVTCFEVLEHVEPEHMLKMLAHIKSLMSPDGVAFFSTPCWDVKSCAANHVNEMKYEALGACFEREGWTIKNVHGTFASMSDYLPHMSPEHLVVFNELRNYYDVNMLACIFAPLYPAYSRNCLWEVTPVRSLPKDYQFDRIASIPEPWGSSAQWKDMAKVVATI